MSSVGGKYAAGTDVPPEKTKMEIERVLAKYGATSFASGWQGSTAVIVFEAHGRRVKFILPLARLHVTKDRRGYLMGQSSVDSETRRLWRCLLLAIKAKLEVVQSGIASFEEEFLAHIVLADGATVGKWMEPQIEEVYRTGKMPPLLAAPATRPTAPAWCASRKLETEK